LKKSILAGLAAPVILFCGCSTFTVTTDYDVAASLGNYRTYALESPANTPVVSPSADSALRIALHENLAARGIREVGVNNRPDLAVVPHARLQQRRTREQYNHWGYGVGGWPFGAGHYGMWIGEPYPTTTIESYTEGTLVLDFVETTHGMLVFRGIGKGKVGSAKTTAENIGEAVEKIVANFPAKQEAPIAGNYASSSAASFSR
jgi:Domain of unknown function (DUF4136)